MLGLVGAPYVLSLILNDRDETAHLVLEEAPRVIKNEGARRIFNRPYNVACKDENRSISSLQFAARSGASRSSSLSAA
jgi:hypothetical protein